MKYNNYSSKKADLSQRSLKLTTTDSEDEKAEEEKGKKTHATKEQMLSLLAGMLKKNQLSIPSSVQETEIHLTRSRWIMRSLRASIWGANALLRVVTSPTNITEEEKFDAILNKKDYKAATGQGYQQRGADIKKDNEWEMQQNSDSTMTNSDSEETAESMEIEVKKAEGNRGGEGLQGSHVPASLTDITEELVEEVISKTTVRSSRPRSS